MRPPPFSAGKHRQCQRDGAWEHEPQRLPLGTTPACPTKLPAFLINSRPLAEGVAQRAPGVQRRRILSSARHLLHVGCAFYRYVGLCGLPHSDAAGALAAMAPNAKRRTTGRSRETPSSPTTDLHSGQFLAQPTSVAICCADYWLLLTTDRLPFPPSLRSQSSTEAFQFPGLEAQ